MERVLEKREEVDGLEAGRETMVGVCSPSSSSSAKLRRLLGGWWAGFFGLVVMVGFDWVFFVEVAGVDEAGVLLSSLSSSSSARRRKFLERLLMVG